MRGELRGCVIAQGAVSQTGPVRTRVRRGHDREPTEELGLGGRQSTKNGSQETKEERRTDQLSEAERLSSDMGRGQGTGVQEW